MSRQSFRAALHVGVLLTVTGAVAWVTGRPFLFPSLGPSAYVLATTGRPEAVTARRVVGGHAVGVVAGLLTYHLVAPGLTLTAPSAPLAGEQFRVAASGVLATVLTTAGMRRTDTGHPPACATTLIVSLGLLPSVRDGVIIVVAVATLFAADRASQRLLGAL